MRDSVWQRGLRRVRDRQQPRSSWDTLEAILATTAVFSTGATRDARLGVAARCDAREGSTTTSSSWDALEAIDDGSEEWWRREGLLGQLSVQQCARQNERRKRTEQRESCGAGPSIKHRTSLIFSLESLTLRNGLKGAYQTPSSIISLPHIAHAHGVLSSFSISFLSSVLRLMESERFIQQPSSLVYSSVIPPVIFNTIIAIQLPRLGPFS